MKLNQEETKMDTTIDYVKIAQDERDAYTRMSFIVIGVIVFLIAALISWTLMNRAWEAKFMTKKYHLQHCTIGLHWSQCQDGTVLTPEEKQSNANFVADMIASGGGNVGEILSD